MVWHQRGTVRLRQQHASVRLVAGLVFLGLARLTSQQVAVWQTDETVWTQAARVSQQPRPFVNLAVNAIMAGELQSAERYLQQAEARTVRQATADRLVTADVIAANRAVIALRRGESDAFLAFVRNAPYRSARWQVCQRISWCQS